MKKMILVSLVILVLSIGIVSAKNRVGSVPKYSSNIVSLPRVYDDFVCTQYKKEVKGGDMSFIEIKRRYGELVEYEDYCRDLYTLVHYSCDNPYPETASNKRCSLSCKNNACVTSPGSTVASSQFLRDSVPNSVKNKEVSGKTVQVSEKINEAEAHLGSLSPTTILSCSETDRGDDIGAQGDITIKFSSGKEERYGDYCQNTKFLFEYDCGNNHPTARRTKLCPIKCESGACVANFRDVYNPWRKESMQSS